MNQLTADHFVGLLPWFLLLVLSIVLYFWNSKRPGQSIGGKQVHRSYPSLCIISIANFNSECAASYVWRKEPLWERALGRGILLHRAPLRL